MVLLSGLSVAVPHRVLADPPVIVPLREYAEHHDVSDRWSRRFVLNRCAALYVFAASAVRGRLPALDAGYEARANAFLAAARAAADENEVLLMLLTRMSTAYRRSSDAMHAGDDPLAHPFFQSELAFCGEYLSKHPSLRE